MERSSRFPLRGSGVGIPSCAPAAVRAGTQSRAESARRLVPAAVRAGTLTRRDSSVCLPACPLAYLPASVPVCQGGSRFPFHPSGVGILFRPPGGTAVRRHGGTAVTQSRVLVTCRLRVDHEGSA